MDPENIQITLSRICSDLNNILLSRGWPKILDTTDEEQKENLETSLGSALFHATDLKLRVNRALKQDQERKRQRYEDAAA
jgi:hypothetical protein